jgi:hypothetical protein
MLKWGWIPKYQGAPVQTGAQVAAHESLFKILGATTAPLNGIPPVIQPSLPGVGLDIAYDTAAGSAASGGNYDRLDQFGRPLPYTPNLPVSPDLLYSGATPGNSLVQ